jgi:thioesterase domain-containing protein
MAVNYEPSSTVAEIDVFYCTPLKIVASSTKQWRKEHLVHWKDFVRGEVAYYEIGGEHYTMLGKQHVHSFQKTLKQVMKARGV